MSNHRTCCSVLVPQLSHPHLDTSVDVATTGASTSTQLAEASNSCLLCNNAVLSLAIKKKRLILNSIFEDAHLKKETVKTVSKYFNILKTTLNKLNLSTNKRNLSFSNSARKSAPVSSCVAVTAKRKAQNPVSRKKNRNISNYSLPNSLLSTTAVTVTSLHDKHRCSCSRTPPSPEKSNNNTTIATRTRLKCKKKTTPVTSATYQANLPRNSSTPPFVENNTSSNIDSELIVLEDNLTAESCNTQIGRAHV